MASAGSAWAATPTYYNNLGVFQGDITTTVTDNYSNPGYVFIQNNAVMSAVIGETDYMSTGFNNLNIINGAGGADPSYCAGCNGSFQLSFTTTSVGTPVGVEGVGAFIEFHDMGTPYFAFITFGDGTTANIALPSAGSFWGVAAPERIVSIHFGLSMGGITTNGSFGIDDLIVGDGNIGACVNDADCIDNGDPCTDPVCIGGMCGTAPNVAPCDDGEPCTENDVCSGGVCGGSVIDCEDGNPCTNNFCNFGSGCVVQPNTNLCDDADPCTTADTCSMGACAGTTLDCDDADVCTADSCDSIAGGCVNDPIPGCCNGDDDCAADELCDPSTNTCMTAPVEDTGAVDGSSTGVGEDTGPSLTTGADGTGAGGTGVGETGVDSGGQGTDDSTGGGGINVPTTGGDPGGTGDTGCACTTHDRPGSAAWWMMLGFGLLVRRRRDRIRA